MLTGIHKITFFWPKTIGDEESEGEILKSYLISGYISEPGTSASRPLFLGTTLILIVRA